MLLVEQLMEMHTDYKQENHAIAKMTAQCAQYVSALNQKHWADFLLVPNSNLGPILHRFRDMIGFMCSSPHPYSTLILGVFPLHQIAHVGVSQSRGLKLFGREIIFEEFKPM